MGGSISRFLPCKSDESRPWLDHPDGKWSPRPRISSDCQVTYEVDGYSLDAEEDMKRQWKASRTALSTATASRVTVAAAWGSSNEFDVELQRVAGLNLWCGRRTRRDFESMHRELEQECSWASIAPLPSTQLDFFHLQPVLWNYHLRDTSAALQQWLKEVIDAGLSSSNAFRSFLGNPQVPSAASSADGERESPSRVALALPIMSEIVEFLDQPRDVVHICSLASNSIRESSALVRDQHWERMYREKWPAFYAAQSHASQTNQLHVSWQAMYRHTASGNHECHLEIYDREKKLGFAMSCMVAKVTWEAKTSSYIVHYVSASQVLPERIPVSEAHRLRFCPPSARALLKPELQPPQASELYTYRILGGIPDLKVGQGVELQWKMQLGSPYGWWYGNVEALERHGDGQTATLTMLFPHFPASSRWHRLHVTVGDGAMRQCAIGGFHGGIRAVTESESKEWMRFFPKEPVIF